MAPNGRHGISTSLARTLADERGLAVLQIDHDLEQVEQVPVRIRIGSTGVDLFVESHEEVCA
jgi:ABC-type oligopeptide transport system ATPase subunit